MVALKEDSSEENLRHERVKRKQGGTRTPFTFLPSQPVLHRRVEPSIELGQGTGPPPLTGASLISYIPLYACSLLEPGSLQASEVMTLKQSFNALETCEQAVLSPICVRLAQQHRAGGAGGELGFSSSRAPFLGSPENSFPFTDLCCEFPFLRDFFKLPVPHTHWPAPVRCFPCRRSWLLRSSLYIEQSEGRGQR